MECPNKCGELIEFQKPLCVAPTEDAMEALELASLTELEKKLQPSHFYQAIHRACPVCGYHESEWLTEEQFTELIMKRRSK